MVVPCSEPLERAEARDFPKFSSSFLNLGLFLPAVESSLPFGSKCGLPFACLSDNQSGSWN